MWKNKFKDGNKPAKLILILLSPLCVKAQNIFPLDDGKIIFRDTINVSGTDFSRQIKYRLNSYANYFNGTILNEENKMKEYVFFEDSATISANIRFQTSQLMDAILWEGIAEFTRSGNSVFCSLYDIRMTKLKAVGGLYSQPNQPLESVYSNSKSNKKMFPLLYKQIGIYRSYIISQ